MFALTDADLGKRVLGCGDGPASFNAKAKRLGLRVVSADPLYGFSAEQIRGRIGETTPIVIAETRRNAGEFVWERFRSVEDLAEARGRAMEEFLADYESGRVEGRYVDAGLPALPFADREFDLALCSHFLFLYSEQHSAEFHASSIVELCRVASEARVFPLLELGGAESRHLAGVVDELGLRGYTVARERVSYEFQRGGNEMLRIGLPPSSQRRSRETLD